MIDDETPANAAALKIMALSDRGQITLGAVEKIISDLLAWRNGTLERASEEKKGLTVGGKFATISYAYKNNATNRVDKSGKERL